MVRDHLAVALLGVQPARRAVLEGRRGDAVSQRVGQQPPRQPQLLRARDPVQRDVRDPLEQGVEVALELQLAGHVRPRQPERPGCRRQPRERARGDDPHRRLGGVRAHLAAVVTDHTDRDVRPQDAADDLRDLHVMHRPFPCPMKDWQPSNTGRAADRAGRSAV